VPGQATPAEADVFVLNQKIGDRSGLTPYQIRSKFDWLLGSNIYLTQIGIATKFGCSSEFFSKCFSRFACFFNMILPNPLNINLMDFQIYI
jgi:hypothetical protein